MARCDVEEVVNDLSLFVVMRRVLVVELKFHCELLQGLQEGLGRISETVVGRD